MTSKAKSALAAVLIAAVATPALAQGAAQFERVSEGRNAAAVHDIATLNQTSSDRNSVVQSLGN